MNWSYTLSLFFGGCIAFSTFALGAFQILFWCMLGFMIADVVIGFVGAVERRDVDSKTFWRGMPHKLITLLFFIVAIGIDVVVQNLISNGVPLPVPEFTFALGACIWIIVSELLSILETMTKSGINVPPFVSEFIEILSKYFRSFKTKETETETETGTGTEE